MEMQAVLVNKYCKAKDLKPIKVDSPKIRANEVLIRHSAIGVNFFDICFRKGQYTISSMPAILGMEACGYVEAVGSKVKNFHEGERVAYATGGIGSYCQKRAIAEQFVVSAQNNLSDVQVAAVLHKGLMAHALLHRVYIAKRAKRILIHAVAGGVGHILCQWAKHLGIEVIGTVGNEEKIGFAKSLGCDHIINYKKEDFVQRVTEITNQQGVGLVYDGVGKDTLHNSLQCLWPMGMCVNYGEASGKTEPLDLNYLFANSLYVTRPTMAMYKSNRTELVLSANEVFAATEKGVIKPKITTYDFKDVAKAHQDLESRKTTGSLVLIPPKN